jgi:restriction system protein
MDEITFQRINEILRIMFELLWFEPQGLYASEIIRYIQTTVPLTDFETGYYPFAPYSPRYEVIIRVGSIPLVRAGWLEKTNNGRWFITPAGREAVKRFNNSEEFFEMSVQMFQEWKSNESLRLAKFSISPFNHAVEYSWDQIRQYIDILETRDLRSLVGVLLKALGCYVSWTAPDEQEDQPIDLIGYLNPLGINSPRLVVQIANKSTVSTKEAVSSFGNILTAKDVGIYISFGGFANDLKESPFVLTNNEIRLIDLEKFVNLWVENQDKIDQENRSKFPLKPIYFLSFPEHV